MRVLVTGGGTGGHINPAIAIANTIRQKEPDSVIAFVGTSRGMENKLVPKEGYPLYHIEVQGISRKPSLKNLKALRLSVTSVFKAKKLIREFKPDLVVGTGGYVCWPVCKAASEMGIPTALHESNALPGVAVKMLAHSVDKIYVNFEKTISSLPVPEKCVRVGNPLKGEYATVSYEEAREKLGITGKFRYSFLSCGGSLGAARINEEVLTMMKEYGTKHPEILFVHASGSAGYEEYKKRFEEDGLDRYPNLRLVEYLYDMPLRLAAADLVLNRAGAMTISELALLGKATILIPSPNVTDNHQYKNAKVLADADAAVLIEEKDLRPGLLTETVDNLISNRERRAKLGENFAGFAIKDTNELLYSGLKALVNSKKM